MERVGAEEEHLEETFIRGGGSGGQKINKTSSCVRLKHVPSGIEVRCQESRSQALNRYYARRLLCDKLIEIRDDEKSKRQLKSEKIRRQKRRRSRRQKEKMMDAKSKQGVKKALRSKPNIDS
ncbi:UNVERIFIED_CONTAM: hypothetical protein GTU68_008973 [Idotea baltica]|nr:hypothetical protein [Idotea baltica]